MEILGKVTKFFKGIEKKKLIRVGILGGLVIILAIVVAILLNQKTYAVLYSGMDTADAGEMLVVLEEMGVDAKARGDDTILVEESQVDTIRMELSAEGYPSSGFNYDIWESASGLSATDMDKEVYYQYQTQENIRETIVKMDKVADAVVNLDISEDSSFVLSDDEDDSSASVMLILEDGVTLSNSEVTAIAELVSKSVSGLELENVRIIDSQMNLYSLEDEDELESLTSQMELQNAVQSQLKDQITSLLTPVFGEDSVIAEVNVILNFDTEVIESTVFEPPVDGEDNEGLIVSLQELSETIKNYEEGDEETVGVDANGGTATYTTDDETTSDAVYEKVTREATMELNETVTMIENAKGSIESLSVSVILDSSNSSYDYTDTVKQLVATAIGVSDENITVEMLPFKEVDTIDVEAAFASQQEIISTVQKNEIIKYIVIAFSALLILILLSAIIRSVTDNSIDYEDYEGVREYLGYEIGADENGQPIAGMAQKSSEEEEEIEIEFEKKDTTLNQIENYVNKSPESVAQLLRKWLYEDYSR